jgi:hypothetical protein
MVGVTDGHQAEYGVAREKAELAAAVRSRALLTYSRAAE